MCKTGFLAPKQAKQSKRRLNNMFKPTVASIVGKLQKTIDQLESLSEATAIEVQSYTDLILEIEEKRAAADIESTRAEEIACKIRNLIGDSEGQEVVIEEVPHE